MLARSCVLIVLLCACGKDSKSDIDAPPGGDASSTSDGSPTDGDVTIDATVLVGPACGATTCTNGSEVCCIGTNSVCRVPGNCPSEEFACDGPEDCTGQPCCMPNNGGSECGGNCQEIACHVDADCGGMKCCPKMFTPGYSSCRAAC